MDADVNSVETGEDQALDELLETIYRKHHYDFRSYTRTSLQRGIARAMASLRAASTADLLARVLTEPTAFAQLLPHLTVNVSDLFRDPSYYRALRQEVVPHLASYASPRIWVAGCGRGEEAYSIAIALHEGGILDRCLIYATDIDAPSLEMATAGNYSSERLADFSQNYLDGGGQARLADYYTRSPTYVSFVPWLKERISFTDHSLATDSAFAEVQLVSCRNVLIYFDQTLQDRATGMFRDSLCPRGFLGLGPKESLTFSAHCGAFMPVVEAERIYRLR